VLSDNNETPVPPQPRKRRRLCPHGAQCRECRSIAETRSVFFYSSGKPHDFPYRHCRCMNDSCPHFLKKGKRRTWNSTIPQAQIIEEI
jgi:hypothetical protein